MIARIRGILEEIDDGAAMVSIPTGGEDAGLSREILVPAYLRPDLLNKVGQLVTLHTLEHLEPMSQGASFVPRLYGFASVQERRFFKLFITVKGVGMRRALRAMTIPPSEIAHAIAQRDAKALVALPEIGNRLAETILAELHGKVDEFVHSSSGPARVGSQIEPGTMASEPARRAVAALIRLGENERDAEALVSRVIDVEEGDRSADELVAQVLAAR